MTALRARMVAAPPALANAHTCCAAALNLNLFDLRPRLYVQAASRLLWHDIGTCCRPAFTQFLSDLINADAFQLRAIKIGVAGQLQLSRGVDKIDTAGIGPELIADG